MTQRLFYTSWYDVCSTPNISTNHLVVFGVVVITHSEIEKNKNKNKSKMAAEGESLSDSQSKVSNASDELTSLESSISDSDSDSKNNNKRLQFFSICWKEKNSSAGCHNKEQQKKRKTRTKKKLPIRELFFLRWTNCHHGYSPRKKLKNWKVQYGSVSDSIRHAGLRAAFEGRRNIALHLTSEEQKNNFELLIIGFCRRFAT